MRTEDLNDLLMDPPIRTVQTEEVSMNEVVQLNTTSLFFYIVDMNKNSGDPYSLENALQMNPQEVLQYFKASFVVYSGGRASTRLPAQACSAEQVFPGQADMAAKYQGVTLFCPGAPLQELTSLQAESRLTINLEIDHCEQGVDPGCPSLAKIFDFIATKVFKVNAVYPQSDIKPRAEVKVKE